MIENTSLFIRSSLRRGLLVFATVAIAMSGQAMAVDRPNILWITTEDMSLNLGSYGDPDAITPVLDQLAKRSVRYTRAQAPAGLPAGAGLLLLESIQRRLQLRDTVRCLACLRS